MAKVNIKSEIITPFGGIFLMRDLFSHNVGFVIDEVLANYYYYYYFKGQSQQKTL